jgi:hypothetical protein
MKKRTLAVAAFAVIAFASCLKNDGSISTPRAGILVGLLSPDANNTTITLNGNTIGTNVSYGSASRYSQITAGPSNIMVANVTLAPLLDNDFTTDPGKYYSIFLVDSASNMQSIIVTDSFYYPGTIDSVKVRFYNFAPNSQGLSIGIKDSGKIWMSRSFETQNSANFYNAFLPMKAGPHTFQIFAPYSATSIKDTTINFDGGNVYTLFLKGFAADTIGSTALGLGVLKQQ